VAADLMAAGCDMVWSADRTTPAEVEEALRKMLVDRHSEHAGCVPARTINLVCVVDARAQRAVVDRLEGPGPGHASRTIVCAIERGRTDIAAVARIGSDMHPAPGKLAVLREMVILAIGERHLPDLESIVDPVIVSDLPTVIWSPHGHEDAVRALIGLAEALLLDSIDGPEPRAALGRARGWLGQLQVVDLAWLRTAPWRERLAATFEPAPLRGELGRIDRVSVRHHPGSTAAALLVVGWLAARLGWRPHALARHQRGLDGTAALDRHDVRIVVSPSPEQQVQGLAGMTLGTRSGATLSLDRAPGGLRARYRDGSGADRSWTLLGASRGEPGILADGIRLAQLRDGLYERAVAVAGTLAEGL
jgi:glucose-6-phosphate dehydrogenase assembly protein OpcA